MVKGLIKRGCLWGDKVIDGDRIERVKSDRGWKLVVCVRV